VRADVQLGLALHHQLLDVDGNLFGETVASGAEHVQRAPVAGRKPPA
jgi:hypothetical protein